MINIRLDIGKYNNTPRIMWYNENGFHRTNNKPAYINLWWFQTWKNGQMTKYFPFSCQAKKIK